MSTASQTSPPPEPLDAAVDGCACPECGMPMAVRRWLGTAECLGCGTEIELEWIARPLPRRPHPRPATAAQPLAAPRRPTPLAAPPIRRRKRSLWRQLHELLAVLASVLAHLLALLLLALLGMSDRGPVDDTIVLSLRVGPPSRPGEEIRDDTVDTVGFDLPKEPPITPDAPPEAVQWAEQLAMAPSEPAPNLPPMEEVAERLAARDPYTRMHSARDPRIRNRVVRQEGGTTQTEAAVARALDWLGRHQMPNGNWSLHRFDRAADCNGRCDFTGHMRSDTGATGLALQAMLGAGQTHRTGRYQSEAAAAIKFLIDSQRRSGDLRGGRDDPQAGMYAHALATIALADALALTNDESLRPPAQRAIDFLVDAQHPAGGWRYQPGEDGDLSVTGWQLMALHSGRAAGLEFDRRVLTRAQRFLDRVGTRDGGYAYMPGHGESAAMTAEGLLSRMYLGTKRNDPELIAGMRLLTTRYDPLSGEPNFYYWYYGTQALHHWGGPAWQRWNTAMRELLVSTQLVSGHQQGSWHPADPHGGPGGRLYTTVLACCTLEVYYRHAPLYRPIDLDR